MENEAESPPHNERLILLILTTVQFITILDFMIVMPLGPQLMRELSIGPADFGLIVSSYTLAAGAAGLVASAVIDHFARRTSFMVLYAGFLIGTLLCGLAPNYATLLIARLITGAFGGILGGLSMAVIGDVFPDSRRGRATSSLMTGFALASVAGVPLGLVIGTNFGWQMSFIALSVVGIPPLLLAPYAMPLLNSHIGKSPGHPLRSMVNVFFHANHLRAFCLIIALTMSSFMVFPYLSAYLVSNVGMSEQQLPLIYIVGGLLTLIAAPIVGRLADQRGKLRVFRIIAPASALLLLVITHVPVGQLVLAVVVFGCLMVCNVGRMIPAMAMITSSVEPRYRGAFLSANSSIQHITGGLGAYCGGLIVTQVDHGPLENFGLVGWIATTAALAAVWLAGRLRPAESTVVARSPVEELVRQRSQNPEYAEAVADVGQGM